MSAALLTQLGQVLGCKDTCTPEDESARGGLDKRDGFPARCWYSGPLEAAKPRAPKIAIERPTLLDREARFLAELGHERLMRFILSRRRPS